MLATDMTRSFFSFSCFFKLFISRSTPWWNLEALYIWSALLTTSDNQCVNVANWLEMKLIIFNIDLDDLGVYSHRLLSNLFGKLFWEVVWTRESKTRLSTWLGMAASFWRQDQHMTIEHIGTCVMYVPEHRCAPCGEKKKKSHHLRQEDEPRRNEKGKKIKGLGSLCSRTDLVPPLFFSFLYQPIPLLIFLFQTIYGPYTSAFLKNRGISGFFNMFLYFKVSHI